MNIVKNMELILVIAIAVVGLGSFLIDFLPSGGAKPAVPVARHIATPTTTAVIVIKGYRLRDGM